MGIFSNFSLTPSDFAPIVPPVQDTATIPMFPVIEELKPSEPTAVNRKHGTIASTAPQRHAAREMLVKEYTASGLGDVAFARLLKQRIGAKFSTTFVRKTRAAFAIPSNRRPAKQKPDRSMTMSEKVDNLLERVSTLEAALKAIVGKPEVRA